MRQILKRHLQSWMYKSATTKMAASTSRFQPQTFDNFLVLDFEATCERDNKIEPQEIIEFPCLKVNAKSFEVEAEFHRYIQPHFHRDLSTFCTELTGITQDMVQNQSEFPDVLQDFESWLQVEEILDSRFTFVTCGDWDLKTMPPNQ